MTRALIADEAANWIVRMHDEKVDRLTKRHFRDWLLESPVHVHEYLVVARLWGDLAVADAERLIEADDFGEADDNVVSLAGGRPVDGDGSARGGRRRRWRLAGVGIAASLVVAVVLGGYGHFGVGDAMLRYETGRGEQRSVVLEDGTLVELNTLTAITVTFADDGRRVELVDGEALFDVATDADRPFTVDTGIASVQVTGTRFNVYKQPSRTAVTVLEGNVRVSRPALAAPHPVSTPGRERGSTADSADLTAGEQAVFSDARREIETVTLPTVDPVVAWMDRRLVFEATPLTEIVAEFNRYNEVQIRLANPELGDLRLSAVFDSNDPASLIDFMERNLGIDVLYETRRSVVTILSHDSRKQ